MVNTKDRLQVTINKELVKWIDSKVKEFDYSSRSHAIEKALKELKDKNP